MVVIWKPDPNSSEGYRLVKGYHRGRTFAPGKTLPVGFVQDTDIQKICTRLRMAAAKKAGIIE